MKDAAEILKIFLDKKQYDQATHYNAVFRSWASVAGDDFAAHSEIKELDNRTIIVEVDHPAWMQMIQMSQKRILSKLKKMYPELGIDRIRIQLCKKEGLKSVYIEPEKDNIKIPIDNTEPDVLHADDFKMLLNKLKNGIDQRAKDDRRES